MADEAVSKAAEKVDLDSMSDSMVEESISINPDANPMDAPPPMNDGVHRVKLSGATDWEMAETKPLRTTGEPATYFKTQFRAQVVDEGPDMNKMAFGRENTLTFDGKNVMAYIILQILGGSKNPEARAYVATLTTPRALAKAFKDALAGEPIIKISTKWVAQYNSSKDEEPAKYKTALSGQKNFPKNQDGTFNPTVVAGGGEVRAQAQIQDYFPA